MERYNYFESIYDDVVQWFKDDPEMLAEFVALNEACAADFAFNQLWLEDSITGNCSGSYWFSTWKAEEALCHNMELIYECIQDGLMSWESLENPEGVDVVIRCNLLPDVVIQVWHDIDDGIVLEDEIEELKEEGYLEESILA